MVKDDFSTSPKFRQTDTYSRTVSRSCRGSSCNEQRHSGTSWRYIIRGASRDQCPHDVHNDFVLPNRKPQRHHFIPGCVMITHQRSRWSSSSSNQHGKHSSAPQPSAHTPPSSSAGTCTKRQSCWSSSLSACWHSKTVASSVHFDPWPLQATSRCFHSSSPPPSSP